MSQKSHFKLTETLIKQHCGLRTFMKAHEYVDDISPLILRGDQVFVKIQGSMYEPYQINITFNEENWKNGSCTCPSENYPCKHIVATLLKIASEGFDSIEPALEERLKTLSADHLRNILINLIESNPELIEDIESELVQPQEENDANHKLRTP